VQVVLDKKVLTIVGVGDGMKQCTKCRQEKELSEFYAGREMKDGHYSQCKECLRKSGREYSKVYRKENAEKIIAYRRSIEGQRYAQEYRKENAEKAAMYNKHYRAANKERLLVKRKQWCEANQKNRIEWHRSYRKNNLRVRIADNLRTRVRQALMGESKSTTTIELLGCTIEELESHIEGQFTDGMSWDNYGFYGWHLDHIVPCASFDLTDPEQQKICFHYTNLQPLWAKDNLSKPRRPTNNPNNNHNVKEGRVKEHI
jgi:hypothetical protein